MLDLKFVRQNPEKVRRAIQLKREKDCLDRVLELDEEHRKKLAAVEKIRAARNKENDNVTNAKKKGEDAAPIIARMGSLSEEIKNIEIEISNITSELNEKMLWLPNIPVDEVPEGGEENNRQVRTWGTPRDFEFTPKAHWDLGKDLGILELERAARLSGSGFTMLVADGARLERALLNFMLDTHRERGYLEVAPPVLVTRNTITNTAQLPKLEEDMYKVPKDELFLIPTAEVPLANFYQGEMIPEEKLPIHIMGATNCFRREAGAHGKDTRGLLRVHQFNKVELIHYVREEDSITALETMVNHAESILQKLLIPYRIVLLASGDMSFASAKTYDIEIWAPGVQKWLEVSSCSTCTDFQARRANIRYKSGKKVHFVHILNGSGVATPRLLVSIMENYQTVDGHIEIPSVLQPYFGGQKII